MRFKTYDFSDPNPVPEFGKIYPYFTYEGYSATGVEKEWKIIEMENDFIKVWIMPDIGGKIWGAVEKSTGKEFIYFNPSVKFRDIAMRGPWTSGGIEINFGIIGRTEDELALECYEKLKDEKSAQVLRKKLNSPVSENQSN